MKSSATMSIGEVAGLFGLATHVLRHWETMGLLSPARATGGRRRYARSDLHRVAGILLAKEAGLALTDIRDILTTADVEKRREITRRHRDELVRRIEEIRAALNLLEGGLACDYEDITECPHYQFLVADRMACTHVKTSNTDQERTDLPTPCSPCTTSTLALPGAHRLDQAPAHGLPAGRVAL